MNPVNLPKDGHYIYLIVNRVNNKVYVGKTRHMYYRCHQYIYDFRERAIGHINDHLHNAMRKYGIDRFEMIPLETCRDDAHATERELYWMDRYRSTEREFGYNLRRDSREGMITHPETSAKISSNLRKQWAEGIRDEHSAKLKANWRENPSRKVAQSEMFRRYKTKYEYILSQPDEDHQIKCDYRGLISYGLKGVIAAFHDAKSDVVEYRGHTIRRVLVCQN